MINRVILVGRITKDPELRYTPNGIATVSFTIACDRQYQSQNGERQADFINCVAWRNQAEFLSRYVHKGYMIGAEGRIQTRTYTDQNNQTRYITEVVCDSVQNLQPRDPNQAPQAPSQRDGSEPQFRQATPNYQKPAAEDNQQSFDVDVTDDDLPF